MFECLTCGAILEPHECVYSSNEELCELYISCPECGGECISYDEQNDEEDA